MDAWSRTAFPTVYCLCLVILFSLDLTDEYAGDVPSKMRRGFGVVNVKTSGAISIVFYTLVILLVGCSWMMMRRIAEYKKKADEEAIKSAVRASISSTCETSTRFQVVSSLSGRDPDGHGIPTLVPGPDASAQNASEEEAAVSRRTLQATGHRRY